MVGVTLRAAGHANATVPATVSTSHNPATAASPRRSRLLRETPPTNAARCARKAGAASAWIGAGLGSVMARPAGGAGAPSW
jgi:hypothetical protein